MSIQQRLHSVSRWYYYLTPAWLLAELVFLPGFRAGQIFGNSVIGIIGFYAVESLIGLAFWKENMFARWVALAENSVYIFFVVKHVVITPMQIMSQLDEPLVNPEALAANYVHSIPGILFSIFNIIVTIYPLLYSPAKNR